MGRDMTRREMLSVAALALAGGPALARPPRPLVRPVAGLDRRLVSSGRLAWRGIDAGFLPEMEALGVQFYSGGAPVDVLRLAAAAGVNLLRIRVWVDPPSGYCGTAQALALAARAHAVGMRVLLNFHLSDSWADPGQQMVPAAWAALSGAALAQRVREYTRDVTAALRDQGTPPAFVQVGNEVTDGVLWPHGRISVAGWGSFAALFSAGTAGVLDALPGVGPGPGADRPRFLLHIDRGGDNAVSRWFYDNAVQAGILFDVVALSYYPWWHGGLEAMGTNVADMAARYGRPVWLVETAYPWTLSWNDDTFNFVGSVGQLQPGFGASPAGQSAFVQRLIDTLARVPNGLGQGLCYWAPEYTGVPGVFGSPWENLALFDFDRRMLPALVRLGAGVCPAVDR